MFKINYYEPKPKMNTHWEMCDFRGIDITVDLLSDDCGTSFSILMDNGRETRTQSYEVFTANDLKRRVAFLDARKNPCGKWNDRSGKRICFSNGEPVIIN